MTPSSVAGTVGRYTLFSEIAAGGMATVHFGRLVGPAGFSRIVAIKRLMPNFARDPEFVAMFLDEARLAARIRHPNVVQTLDIVAGDGELLLIMEYVQGESLSRLLRASVAADQAIPLPIVSAIVVGALHGLHAAHEATGEGGELLRVVHRDVSPQNLLVAGDGSVKVLDFGIASAIGRLQVTRDGQLKGKLPYMAPEQLWGESIDRRVDIYAMAVVLWECLTRQRLFRAESDAAIVTKVLHEDVPPPSSRVAGLPDGLDELVLRGLSRDRGARFATAREMALALEELLPPATTSQVARWVESMAGDVLQLRTQHIQDIESSAGTLSPEASLIATAPRRLALAAVARQSQSPDETPTAAAPPAPDSTTITSSTDMALAQLRPARRSTVALGAGAALAAALLGAWALSSRPSDPPTDGAPAAASSLPGAPGASAPAAPAASAAPAAPSASASAAAPAAAAPAGKPAGRPRRGGCSPFYTDAQGIQRVNKNCL